MRHDRTLRPGITRWRRHRHRAETAICPVCGGGFAPVTVAGKTKLYCSPKCRRRAHQLRHVAKSDASIDALELCDRVRVKVVPDVPEPVERIERPFLAPTAEPEDPAITAILRPPALPCKL
jgi:hypothetical protein